MMQPFGCMTPVFHCINHLEDFFLVPKCCHVKSSQVSDSKHSRRLATSLWAFLFLFFSGRSECLCCELFNFTESDMRGFLLQKNTSPKEVELCSFRHSRWYMSPILRKWLSTSVYSFSGLSSTFSQFQTT